MRRKLSPKLRRVLTRWLSFILILAAFVGLFEGFAPNRVPPLLWLYLFVGGSVAFLVYLWKTAQEPYIDPDVLSPEEGDEPKELIVAPPTHLWLAANAHTHQVFPHDYLGPAVTGPWWQKNPFGLAVLVSRRGDYLGFFSCLPLVPEAVRRIEEGTEIEREIDPSDILAPDVMRGAATLYFAGIAVKDASTDLGRFRAATMFATLPKYFDLLYGPDRRRIIALAASEDGERILRHMPVTLVCSRHARRDDHNLYEVTLTSELAQMIAARAGKRALPVPVRVNDKPGSYVPPKS